MTVLCTTTATNLQLMACNLVPRAQASGRVVRAWSSGEGWTPWDVFNDCFWIPGVWIRSKVSQMITVGKEVTPISRF